MGCTCFGVSIVWRKSGDARDREDLEGKQLGNIHNFSHNELRNATDNFHRSNKLGQGGFGIVYKAWQLYEEGKLLELVDPELDDFPEEEITRYIKVAFFCTQAVANRRPLMSQVIEMLSRNIRLNEKQLTAPGYFQDSGSLSELPFSNKKSSESSTSYQMSSAPITVTQVTPR
ncbi:hypothetical protein RHGRI_004632 [Rhododendron griersonianum]|uniref:Uncharacterized protein n=1 Tax=Rhododendron griersonianum TaxID=479676 RepID=A0AAV6L9N5_9ERIC|nr:hypothetical protein RHGRI_004632 [Rhododendron griersonianum]